MARPTTSNTMDRFRGVVDEEENRYIEEEEQEQEEEEDDPNAPMQLAVLGPQDDLSTIAGDTLGGGDSVVTEAAVFSKANLPRAIQTKYNKPKASSSYQTPIKSATTTTKSKGFATGQGQEEDEQTQPETPMKVIGLADEDADYDEKDAETWASYRRPSKKMYLCALVVAVTLLVMIITLGVVYVKMHGDDDGDVNPKVVVPTKPSSEEDGGFTDDELAALTPEKPVATDPPDQESLQILLDVLEKTGISDPSSIVGTTSPQAQAIIWVAADPNFDDYTESRLVQRYALAVLAFGFEESEEDEDPDIRRQQRGRRSLSEALPLWLEYETNECDWFTTLENEPVCDGLGFYRRLELADQGLSGTIPTEIALLSNSLAFIDLRRNQLDGTIPSEISNLFQLQSIVVSNNLINGGIPTELGWMEGLAIFSAGQNDLSGGIPTEIGEMKSLTRLLLANNVLQGSIPFEITTLQNLASIDLSGNKLSGQVPFFSNVTVLTSLNIQYNNLSGPVEFCPTELVADCHLLDCACCTICTETPMPTAAPTVATNPPTESPTPKPIEQCNPSMQFTSECSIIEEPFEVRFTNCDPQPGDWIGIYDKHTEINNLPNPYLWLYSCGSQDCQDSPREGVVRFSGLPKGDYFAYMIRNSGSQVFLQTGKLKMKDWC